MRLSVTGTATQLAFPETVRILVGYRKQEGAQQAEVSFTMRATISFDLEIERKELMNAPIDCRSGRKYKVGREIMVAKDTYPGDKSF